MRHKQTAHKPTKQAEARAQLTKQKKKRLTRSDLLLGVAVDDDSQILTLDRGPGGGSDGSEGGHVTRAAAVGEGNIILELGNGGREGSLGNVGVNLNADEGGTWNRSMRMRKTIGVKRGREERTSSIDSGEGNYEEQETSARCTQD